MSDPNSRSGDFGYHLSAAWREIKKQLAKKGIEPKDYDEPKIITDVGTYKVEWYQKDAEGTITLYEDGVWTLEEPKQTVEGKMTPLHYKAWVRRLIKEGVHYGFAACGWQCFKELKKRN